MSPYTSLIIISFSLSWKEEEVEDYFLFRYPLSIPYITEFIFLFYFSYRIVPKGEYLVLCT